MPRVQFSANLRPSLATVELRYRGIRCPTWRYALWSNLRAGMVHLHPDHITVGVVQLILAKMGLLRYRTD